MAAAFFFDPSGGTVSDEPSPTVVGMLQQWLARVEAKLDHLTSALDGKADRSEIEALRREFHQEGRQRDERLGQLEREVEHQKRSDDEATEEHRYKTPMQLTLALVGLGVLTIAEGLIPLFKK